MLSNTGVHFSIEVRLVQISSYLGICSLGTVTFWSSTDTKYRIPGSMVTEVLFLILSILLMLNAVLESKKRGFRR